MTPRSFVLSAANVAAIALIVLGLVAAPPSSSLLIQIPGGLGSTLVGSLIVLRVRGNRVGVLLVVLGLLLIAVDVVHLLVAEHGAEGLGAVAAIGEASLFVPQMMCLSLMVMIFPTGVARWRWLSRSVVVVGVAGFLAGLGWALSKPATELVADLHSTSAANPAEISAALIFLSLPVALASLVARYRASDPVERTQIRWLLFAAAILFLAVLGPNLTGEYDGWVAIGGFSLAAAMIPATIGMAVTRYRLYSIDRLIARTVTYAFVVALLGVVYAVAVLELTPGLGGEAPSWLVAATTLVVAAAFNPLRRRVQRAVDRRFDRARFDAEELAERFAIRVRDDTDLGGAPGGLAEIAGQMFRPSSVSLWVDGGRV